MSRIGRRAPVISFDLMSSAAPQRPPPPTIAPTAFERLRALYERADDAAVQEHLAAHPEVVPVLIEAAAHLRGVFGAGVVLRLEPPYFAGDELFARVYRHGLDAEGADSRTEQFWQRWWHEVEPERDAARRWLEFGIG